MTEFEVAVNAALLPDTGSDATKDPIISKIVRIARIVRIVTAPSKSPRINQKYIWLIFSILRFLPLRGGINLISPRKSKFSISLVITKLYFFKLRGDLQETPATPETGWEPPETPETERTPGARMARNAGTASQRRQLMSEWAKITTIPFKLINTE